MPLNHAIRSTSAAAGPFQVLSITLGDQCQVHDSQRVTQYCNFKHKYCYSSFSRHPGSVGPCSTPCVVGRLSNGIIEVTIIQRYLGRDHDAGCCSYISTATATIHSRSPLLAEPPNGHSTSWSPGTTCIHECSRNRHLRQAKRRGCSCSYKELLHHGQLTTHSVGHDGKRHNCPVTELINAPGVPFAAVIASHHIDSRRRCSFAAVAKKRERHEAMTTTTCIRNGLIVDFVVTVNAFQKDGDGYYYIIPRVYVVQLHLNDSDDDFWIGYTGKWELVHLWAER